MQRKRFLKLALLTNLGLVLKPGSIFSSNIILQSTDNVLYYKNGTPEYEALRKGFNKRIEKFPLIIALCKNTAGVAEAIQYAKQNNLPVAIKSGGF
jgi:FAD/FMN-containing dehydrogenase